MCRLTFPDNFLDLPFSMRSLTEITAFALDAPPRCHGWFAGDALLIADDSGQLYRTDGASPRPLPTPLPVRALASQPTTAHWFTADDQGDVYAWHADQLGPRLGHADQPWHLALSPRGHCLAAAAGSRLHLWPTAPPAADHAVVCDFGRTIHALHWFPGGGLAVAGERLLALVECDTGRALELPLPTTAQQLAASADGRWLAAHDGAAVSLWRLDLLTMPDQQAGLGLPPTESPIVDFAWRGDGQYLAVATTTATALWHCRGANPQALPALSATNPLHCLAFAPGLGVVLATGDAAGVVTLHHPRHPQALALAWSATAAIRRLVWQPNGRELLVFSDAPTVHRLQYRVTD